MSPDTLDKTLVEHTDRVLADFDHRISSGPIENTNKKIEVLERDADGYRDDEFFRLELLGLPESRCEFVG
jgi:transposase